MFFALTLFALAAFPPGDDFETLLKEFDGGPKKAEDKVIQAEEDWKAFVATCTSEAVRKRLLEQKPDFAKETVAVMAFGDSRDILGAEYEKMAGIRAVKFSGKQATVEATLVGSDHRSTKPMYPLHIIKMRKVKDVEFKKTRKNFFG